MYQWFIKHIEKLYCEQCNLQLDHKQLVYSVKNSYKSHNLKHIELNTKKLLCKHCRLVKRNTDPNYWTLEKRKKVSEKQKMQWEENYDKVYEYTQSGQRKFIKSLTKDELIELNNKKRKGFEISRKNYDKLSDEEKKTREKHRLTAWKQSIKDYFNDSERQALSNLMRECLGKNTNKLVETVLYYAKSNENDTIYKIGISNGLFKRSKAFGETRYYDYKVLHIFKNRYLAAAMEYLIRITYCNDCVEEFSKTKLSKVKQLINDHSSKDLINLLKEHNLPYK